MNVFDKYILKKFEKEFIENKKDYKLLESQSIWKFRYICYKFNYFLKQIPIPNIKKNSFYEAVFIDFRILPNIEFIIRNAIIKLGGEWSFTIICGLKNYDYIVKMVNDINKNIKIIKLEYENLSQEEYSNLLTTETFWNKLNGDKILIYQEDSLIFHNNIAPFLEYDYIGAPFQKNSNDTPNCVGNGGLSIRTKIKMLEVIKKCKIEETKLNSSTVAYMKFRNMKNPPEDVYFSKNLQERNIGDVASWDTAYNFSSEQIFNPKSFGGHAFWNSNKEWQTFLKQLFKYKPYRSKSKLNDFLEFKNIPINFNKNQQISNAFDIDIYFFCKANNIQYVNDTFTLEYINNIALDGFIYHPKQLLNIFGEDIELYNFLDNIYVFYDYCVYTIQDFVNKYIYNTNFDYLSNLLIKKKYDVLNDNYDTMLLVFLGNEQVAHNLLFKIIKYKKINTKFNVAFCINKKAFANMDKIKSIIQNNFDFYAIYYSKEMGTDITPTILMYNDIIKKHDMKHIIKLHTKTISNIYHNLTDYLLKNDISKIINNKNNKCHCIGPTNSYMAIKADVFNNKLKEKHKYCIQSEFSFVAGTIFYAKKEVFNKVLEFIKHNNYRAYLLNNLYENNTINHDFSPIHFLERLFGSIRL